MKKSYLLDVPRRWLDVGLSLASIIFGIVLLLYMPSQKWWKPDSAPSANPGFLPDLIAKCLIVVGVALLVRSVYRFKKEESVVTVNCLSAVIFVIWWLYAMVMPYLGFILSSMIVLAVSMAIWGVKKKRVLILCSTIIPVVLYFLLAVVLKVKFPTLFL